MLIKKRNKKRRKRLLLLFGTVLTLLLFVELRIKPITSAAAEAQAQAMAVGIIHQSIDRVMTGSGVSFEDLETVVYTGDEKVASIHTDTAAANRLKNSAALAIQEGISGIKSYRLDVPAGTVLGGELFSGLGPSLPVFISLTGSVSADFHSAFEQGGINQTVHRLSLDITADITILMPVNSVTTRVQTSVLLGETVIVGSVPDMPYTLYANKNSET